MADPKGNGGSKDLEHMSLEEFKELIPGADNGPLFSGVLGDSNAGVRLLSNDETITEMLKGLNFNDENQAAACAFALGENEIFLYNKDGKINKEVERIRARIKYRATSQCSVKGQWADQYKQAAIGVATNTATAKGWSPLAQQIFQRRGNDDQYGNSNKSPNNRRP